MITKKTQRKTKPEIIDELSELVPLKNKIIELLAWYDELKSQKGLIELKLDKKKFNDKITVRSFRIYNTILKKFEIFANEHSQYKNQDLVSQALLEFIEKYR